MTTNSPASIGDVGESAAGLKLQRLHWNVLPSNNRDEGTDLIVMANEVDLHSAFGVQVKTGPSYFRRKKRDGEGKILGWWYYESSVRHFDYWTGHTLPHILVLYDDDNDAAYWVHVTADNVTSTGKGCKILVPADQAVDEDHRADLLAVAYGRGNPPTLEGTAFWAAAEKIAPKQQLRYALIAPRLVAPHRNAGYGNPISAVEAVALLAQGRFRDLGAFAEQHPEVPDPREEPPVGTDWAWSFAAAIWNWATTGSVDRLSAAFASAPGGNEKAASGVLLACALQRLHSHGEDTEPHMGHGEAMAVLDELAERSDLDAADLGWILVQRARANGDAGRDDEAEADASVARENLVDRSDVTATALAGAATSAVWGIVAARNFEEADIGDLMTASDNAVSWWRSQTISRALTSAAGKQFDSWAEKRFLFQIGDDAGGADLFAAELNADLLGDHGIWQHISSLKARRRMMGAAPSNDEVSELVEGLDALRGSGDDSSLESAITHLRRVGPIEAVAKSVNKISTDGWTRTTAPANFSALRLAGDLMDEAAATDLLVWIARSAGGDRTEYDERVLKTVLVEHSVFGAAVGLMRSADSNAHQAVAKMVGALPHPQLDHPASHLPDIIDRIDFDQVAVPERNALADLGRQDQGRSGAAALGWLAADNDADALAELKHRAASGDLAALEGIPAGALDDSEAELIIGHLEAMVRQTLSSACNGSLNLMGPDTSGALTWLNLRFPGVARWDPIIDLLCEPLVYEGDKRRPCSLIIETPELLPRGPRNTLADNIDSVGEAVRAFASPSDSGIGVAISIAIDVISGDDADTAIAKLASGSPQQRQDVALLLGSGHRPNMQPVLAALAGDARFDVRRAAAEAVGKLAAANPSPQIIEVARRLAADQGTELPETLLIGMAQHNQLISDVSVDIAQQLSQSPSARARDSAKYLLNRDFSR